MTGLHMPEMRIIRTARLTLRPACLEDWPDYAAFLASDRAAHMGGPFDDAGAWGMFCHDIAQWPLMGHGSLMIEARESEPEAGLCVGQVGINSGPLFPEHELGWLLYPGFEGRGYAFEAATALRAWAFGVLGLKTLVSYVHHANTASRKLAERLGAVPDAGAPRHDPQDLVYRHPRP